MRQARPRNSPDRTRSGLFGLRSGPVADTATRTGLIYRIPVWEIDARTGMIALYDDLGRRTGEVADLRLPHQGRPRIVYDYIGQTVRGATVREAEHIETKCWADLIAGPIEIIEQGLWDKATRDRKEIAAIHVLAPRFNYEHNLDNPARIPLPRQTQLRHARDRAAGRPLWLPLEQRTAAAVREAELNTVQAGLDGREPVYPVQWAWRALKATGRALARTPAILQWSALALALAGFGLWAGTQALQQLLAWPRPYALGFSAAAVGSVLLAAAADQVGRWRTRRRNRQRRRHRRKR